MSNGNYINPTKQRKICISYGTPVLVHWYFVFFVLKKCNEWKQWSFILSWKMQWLKKHLCSPMKTRLISFFPLCIHQRHSPGVIYTQRKRGHISLIYFFSWFKFSIKCILPLFNSIRLLQSPHMPRQCSCSVRYKILSQWFNLNFGWGRIKHSANLDYDAKKLVSWPLGLPVMGLANGFISFTMN